MNRKSGDGEDKWVREFGRTEEGLWMGPRIHHRIVNLIPILSRLVLFPAALVHGVRCRAGLRVLRIAPFVVGRLRAPGGGRSRCASGARWHLRLDRQIERGSACQ